MSLATYGFQACTSRLFMTTQTWYHAPCLATGGCQTWLPLRACPNIESHIVVHGTVGKDEEVLRQLSTHLHLNQGTWIMLLIAYMIAMVVKKCSHCTPQATICTTLVWLLVILSWTRRKSLSPCPHHAVLWHAQKVAIIFALALHYTPVVGRWNRWEDQLIMD